MTQLKDIGFQDEVITQGELNTALDGKVDKISGKQLSQEDYTTAEKSKLATLEDIKTFVTVGFSESDYICDGTADNVQIQAAIDVVTTNGGTILLKKGTYNLANNIQIKSNVNLIGEGAGTIIRGTTGIGGLIYQGTSIIPTNASIKDLVLDCNSVSGISGMQIFQFNKLLLENIIVKNTVGVWGIKLGNYNVDANSEKSYELTMRNVVVDTVTGTSLEGFLLTNTNRFTIESCVFKNCDLTNASTVSLFLLCKNGRFIGNSVENAVDDYGLLDLTGVENVSVIGNTLSHTGTTGANGIVNRNTNNVTITGNTLNGKVMSGAGGNGIIILDWSGTIDGHTNPFPYTENLVISSNIITGFDSSFNFSNSDASTNCGWSNITISNNQCTGFNYSFLTSRHVSGRNSDKWNIIGNNVTPRSAGDKLLVWLRASGSLQNVNLLIDGNSFNPTTSNNTTVFSFDKADKVIFGINYAEAIGSGTIYNLGTSTNITYYQTEASSLSSYVGLTGNQTIAGEKTFTDKQWAKEIQITDQLTLETLTGTGYITFVGFDSSGATLFNISPVPSSASGASNIRLFRDVTTTGDVGLEIYRGNGTSSLNSRMLGYGNTYFNALTGNVGIGNTSPGEKLDVTGKIRASDTVEVNRSSNPSFAYRVSGTQKYSTYYNSSSGYFSISQTGVADSFNIKDGGNVGIGETNPDYKLDVNGAIGFTPGIGTTITPVDNGDIVFQATSNTSLVIKMKGSDGVIRSTTLTLT